LPDFLAWTNLLFIKQNEAKHCYVDDLLQRKAQEHLMSEDLSL